MNSDRSTWHSFVFAKNNLLIILKAHIDNETMSTEVQGTAPLDMMQYKNIFASCREPHLPLDKLHLAKDSRHIVIAHQGNFYEVRKS